MEEKGKKLAAAKSMYQKKSDGEVFGYAARLYDFFKKDTRLIEITSDRIEQYKAKRGLDGLTPDCA